MAQDEPFLRLARAPDFSRSDDQLAKEAWLMQRLDYPSSHAAKVSKYSSVFPSRPELDVDMLRLWVLATTDEISGISGNAPRTQHYAVEILKAERNLKSCKHVSVGGPLIPVAAIKHAPNSRPLIRPFSNTLPSLSRTLRFLSNICTTSADLVRRQCIVQVICNQTLTSLPLSVLVQAPTFSIASHPHR